MEFTTGKDYGFQFYPHLLPPGPVTTRYSFGNEVKGRDRRLEKAIRLDHTKG